MDAQCLKRTFRPNNIPWVRCWYARVLMNDIHQTQSAIEDVKTKLERVLISLGFAELNRRQNLSGTS